MDNKSSDWQILVNVTFGLVSLFGGWILKIIFGLMSKMQEDYKDLSSRAQNDNNRLSKDLTDFALSIPEKYVSKHDFELLVKTVHHRFDRLEEKIDSLKETK